jgi:hypothetical protein
MPGFGEGACTEGAGDAEVDDGAAEGGAPV